MLTGTGSPAFGSRSPSRGQKGQVSSHLQFSVLTPPTFKSINSTEHTSTLKCMKILFAYALLERYFDTKPKQSGGRPRDNAGSAVRRPGLKRAHQLWGLWETPGLLVSLFPPVENGWVLLEVIRGVKLKEHGSIFGGRKTRHKYDIQRRDSTNTPFFSCCKTALCPGAGRPDLRGR